MGPVDRGPSFQVAADSKPPALPYEVSPSMSGIAIDARILVYG